MQKLVVVVALCLAAILGVISPALADEPVKVRFSTQCDMNGNALAQFATGYRNNQQAAIGVSLLAQRATASAELTGFPLEAFTGVSGTASVNQGFPANSGNQFSVIVRSEAENGALFTGTALVAVPADRLAFVLSVTPAQLSPPLPANTRIKDVTFRLKGVGGTFPLVTITALGINSRLISFSMDAPLSTCP